jgi:cell division protein FtsQ
MSKPRIKIVPIVVLLLLVAVVVAANVWRNRSSVRNIRVEIAYADGDTLVTPQQVASLVQDKYPGMMTSRLRDVDLKTVAQAAASSPWLYDCVAGTSIGGDVVVHAVQRRPIVRVCSQGSEYYLDDQAKRVPLSQVSECDVLVASGNIPEKGKGLEQVWNLASYLDRHPDLSPLFDQIYRDGKGDLFLTPKLGNHVVQMGSDQNLDEKFRNLLVLYKQGLPKVGWETYSQISVKYHGQVVCTKRNIKFVNSLID